MRVRFGVRFRVKFTFKPQVLVRIRVNFAVSIRTVWGWLSSFRFRVGVRVNYPCVIGYSAAVPKLLCLTFLFLATQTLYLSQVITKCVWDNALSTRAMAATTSHPRRLLPSVQVSPTTQDFPLLKSSLEKGRCKKYSSKALDL